MMTRIAMSAIAFTLLACAEPKHAPADNAFSESQAQSSANCSARFASELCVDIRWEKAPTESDFGSFIFKIHRANLGDGSAVPVDLEGTVSAMLWMPSMNHGSSPIRVEKLDIGTYRASRVFFTMRGEWTLHIQQKNSGTLTDEAVLPLTF